MHRLGGLGLVVVGVALLLAGCGGGDDAGANGAAGPITTAASDSVDPPRTEAQDRRELETLVRAFFEALVRGDGGTVWSLITTDLQAEVERADVEASVDLVAQAYANPGFRFNGFRFLTIEGDRAEFQIDAFITDGGVRVGTAAQAAESPPLRATFEGGRWRLSPDVGLLRLSQTQIDVGG